MALLAIAYPELADSDMELIQNYRAVHDELYYGMVLPHFTLVFPVTDFSEEDFRAEIKKQLPRTGNILFTLRHSIINKDAFTDYYHTFLIPREGYSQFVKLHDQLYSERLLKHLRRDIEFIPHIGIGNSTNETTCKKMADEWNANDFAINGMITSVDIVCYENKTVTTIEKIKLS